MPDGSDVRSDRCPTCGSRVRVITGDDGTSYFAPAGSDVRSEAPLVPRPGRTLEQEYRALSDEFFAVEESRDRLAAEAERLRERIEELHIEGGIVKGNLTASERQAKRLREAIRAMSSEVDPIKRNQIASGALDLTVKEDQ